MGDQSLKQHSENELLSTLLDYLIFFFYFVWTNI